MPAHQRALATLMAVFAAAAVTSCGGDDDSGSTPATCEAICARQNQLCGDTDDCNLICSTIADANAKSGCGDEFQDGLDCLAKADVCDDDSSVCPGESFTSCISKYCMSHAAESICQ